MYSARRCLRRLPAPCRTPPRPLSSSPLPHRTSVRCVSDTAAAVRHTEPEIIDPQSSTEPPSPVTPTSRLDRIKSAKPFSEFLTDSFAREHTYLRISLTERCNLRCLYCMPAEGVPLSPPDHLLSTPEILELSRLFVSQGVNKIRLTGGEPTVRKDILELVQELDKLRPLGLQEIAMTSNGVVLGSGKRLQRMVDAGLNTLNLSLDTLVPAKFEFMTRRKGLQAVLRTIEHARAMGFGVEGTGRKIKINCVVMKNVNDDEILDFVEMTRDMPVEVRFIEYMPFDGNKWNENKMVSYKTMLDIIHTKYPSFAPLAVQRPNDTSKTYSIPGFAGTVGFITSMTHNFCGTCNRLRITSDGNIKVCLFGENEVSLRDLLREFRARNDEVGGILPGLERAAMEQRLLEVVGVAVKGKKKAHAGIPWKELKDGRNRPMILIGG